MEGKMKAKYLKPAFLEKSDDVKLTFVVTADEAAQVFSLKRGESYEIAPYSQEVAGDSQTPTEKLEMAYRLIGEVMGTVEEAKTQLPLEVKKCCGTCAEWTEDEEVPKEGDTSWGKCAVEGGIADYEYCDAWREDK